MGADLELIKYKKDKYGDSFTPLAEVWSDQTGVRLLPRDVAKMMKQLKETRMNNLIHAHINAKSDIHRAQLEEAIEAPRS